MVCSPLWAHPTALGFAPAVGGGDGGMGGRGREIKMSVEEKEGKKRKQGDRGRDKRISCKRII